VILLSTRESMHAAELHLLRSIDAFTEDGVTYEGVLRRGDVTLLIPVVDRELSAEDEREEAVSFERDDLLVLVDHVLYAAEGFPAFGERLDDGALRHKNMSFSFQATGNGNTLDVTFHLSPSDVAGDGHVCAFDVQGDDDAKTRLVVFAARFTADHGPAQVRASAVGHAGFEATVHDEDDKWTRVETADAWTLTELVDEMICFVVDEDVLGPTVFRVVCSNERAVQLIEVTLTLKPCDHSSADQPTSRPADRPER